MSSLKKGIVFHPYPLNPIIGKPMKGLNEEQKAEHDSKRYIKFIPENRKRKQGLCDEEP